MKVRSRYPVMKRHEIEKIKHLIMLYVSKREDVDLEKLTEKVLKGVALAYYKDDPVRLKAFMSVDMEPRKIRIALQELAEEGRIELVEE